MEKSKITGILRGIRKEDILKVGEILIKYNIKDFEVTYNTKDSLEIVKMLKKEFPDARIGMGTILSADDLKKAEEAGAEFILTPSVNEEVLKYSRERNIDIIPGVFSPSEVALALRYGFNYLKLFPAIDLPDSYIKNLKGPFDNVEFMAVGGVEKGNITDFFRAGFVSVGMGSSLIKKAYLENQDWESMGKHAKEIKNIVESM
ncbi:bifunctional 4-hydroxy-2-oxoglutarate aldolase/2-dehydro-3-deoxy-phosphogluconate aldolase [Sebaldella sp. S0638]|uniref:bifunctional 4-hydroxy-2-oxoglutarate aldolase/2-dehydro-3-deoxy-phosphogluconate aldolase n=1 Tax=Sebaldella sp. S0638 TaxID=2957809 RepID=UPI00209C9ECC|nr:bifunctional 4-hydroxy-2-oxoglutarate aldolase/2-dehydro-3-deoxy-phosphogluconate aldolase [Sebaldella sp. S0638]MCP1224002.1 bifunctional 4-hydroxy-2-oxoglutarate aldolase/2-dehydro-3-deoxy-phosphogluconate aldolase [Sebaldella sp. S0638]